MAALRPVRARTALLVALTLVSATSVSGTARAGGATGQANLDQTFSWHSNAQLLTQDARPLWGSTTSPQLTLKNTTPTGQAALNLRLDQNVFNQSALNSSDLHGHATLAQDYQNWGVQWENGVDYDTSLTSETTAYGLAPGKVRHTGLNSAPSFYFRPNAYDELGLAGSYSLSKYDRSDYQDYNLYKITPSYTRQFSALSSGFATVDFQRYQTLSGQRTTVDSAAPMVGWGQTLSPRLTLKLATGLQINRERSGTQTANASGPRQIYQGQIAFTGTQDKLSLEGSRQQTAYGNGTSPLENNIGIKGEHKLTSRLSFNLSAHYRSASYQIQSAGDYETATDGNIGLLYQLTPVIGLQAQYSYRTETLVDRRDRPQDHAATLALTIHSEAWSLRP